MFYRKRPIVIEAFQLTEDKIPLHKIPKEVMPSWLLSASLMDSSELGSVTLNLSDNLVIHTLEGFMHVTPGDFVIKGIHGELYPCKPDIFKVTYEPLYPER